MPKVRDLGVTVVPEGFGPIGIGQGAGCGCTNVTNPCLLCTQNVTVCAHFTQWACARISHCTDCTTTPYSICGTSPRTVPCTDCTTTPFSICGTSPNAGAGAQLGAAGPGGCTDCTTTPFSICGTSPGTCTDCTTTPFSICGTSPKGCSDCTTTPFSICGTTPKVCTDCTNIPFSICGTTPVQPPQRGLTQEHIKQLRGHLQAQLEALDHAEKALLPQSEADIDAREKELHAELEKLRSHRESLKKSE